VTEDDAHGWIRERFDPVACERIDRFVAMVAEETAKQNLIAPSTLVSIRTRHVVDSLQLIDLAAKDGAWLDIGTGGGFPGLVVAIVRDTAMHLVEPRRKRAEFLSRAAAMLELSHVTVHVAKVEGVALRAKTISARAVASIPALVEAARHVASRDTIWLLPRGRSAPEEASDLHQHARVFHVEQSITDPDSKIVVLRGVTGR
jgi:16S rRNA (guanine527-N7)-methyltransferase